MRPALHRPSAVLSRFPRVSVSRALATWYALHKRRLPWRETRDPYRIWVSEVMLQQTRAATVVPYYRRFLRKFPGLRALSEARVEEVLSAWSGLGYYRRARSLHAAAREVVERFRGKIPADPLLLRRLPGVGSYTAGALASIAFGLAEPALDGNSLRVLGRLLALGGDPASPLNRKVMEEAARRLLAGGVPGDINQALMELGARVCLPVSPRCGACPVPKHCRARMRGLQSVFPATSRGRPSVVMKSVAAVIRRRNAYLMVRRDGKGLMEGLWEFPGGFLNPGEEARRGLIRLGRERLGTVLRPQEKVATFRQAITYRRVKVDVYRATLSEPLPGSRRPGDAVRWIRPADLEGLPHGSATRRILEKIGPGRPAKFSLRVPGGRR
jgi:A/G-specific adenine glycosylase